MSQKVVEEETLEQWLARGNEITQLDGFKEIAPRKAKPEPKAKRARAPAPKVQIQSRSQVEYERQGYIELTLAEKNEIQGLIDKHGLSQEAVSIQVGRSKTYLNAIITTGRKTTPDMVQKFKDAIDYLIATGWKKPNPGKAEFAHYRFLTDAEILQIKNYLSANKILQKDLAVQLDIPLHQIGKAMRRVRRSCPIELQKILDATKSK